MLRSSTFFGVSKKKSVPSLEEMCLDVVHRELPHVPGMAFSLANIPSELIVKVCRCLNAYQLVDILDYNQRENLDIEQEVLDYLWKAQVAKLLNASDMAQPQAQLFAYYSSPAIKVRTWYDLYKSVIGRKEHEKYRLSELSSRLKRQQEVEQAKKESKRTVLVDAAKPLNTAADREATYVAPRQTRVRSQSDSSDSYQKYPSQYRSRLGSVSSKSASSISRSSGASRSHSSAPVSAAEKYREAGKSLFQTLKKKAISDSHGPSASSRPYPALLQSRPPVSTAPALYATASTGPVRVIRYALPASVLYRPEYKINLYKQLERYDTGDDIFAPVPSRSDSAIFGKKIASEGNPISSKLKYQAEKKTAQTRNEANIVRYQVAREQSQRSSASSAPATSRYAPPAPTGQYRKRPREETFERSSAYILATDFDVIPKKKKT